MPALDNPRQEKFCQLRAQGKTLEEAYEEAGFKPNRKNAQRLTANEGVARRLKELQERVAAKFEVTVESMAKQFDEDRAYAINLKQMGAAVAAGQAKAKLFGLMIDKQNVSVTHSFATMTEEELRFEIAAINAEARQIKPGVQH